MDNKRHFFVFRHHNADAHGADLIETTAPAWEQLFQ
jgi:hypothetical protein